MSFYGSSLLNIPRLRIFLLRSYLLIHEIMQLLRNRFLTLSDLSFRLKFSSQSYFSRYVLKHAGMAQNVLRRWQVCWFHDAY